ncbi:MAG: pseudaminic acid synthase [Psychrilyobacter sp.]|uniref:pseudaminic acid synthase n=1 Tax=Psychrilyobacter sp. TaxID=2586924 RepID=UPI003C76B8E4
MSNTFIIGEISANHGNDVEIVKKTMKKLQELGADAVKIQTYTADTITIDCNKELFKVKGTSLWDGMNLYDLYKEASTPWEWHKELFEYAKEIGITLFSTPFDKTAVDLLEECGNPIYKVASFEIMDIPLIEYMASKGKPMIMSTGVATLEEIYEAVEACKKMGNNDITLLKCTSQYPAKLEDANLRTMVDMKDKFGVKVGLSDHTMGSAVPVAATTLGAEVIEKHFILDREIGGPDASFSMTPEEFKEMVDRVREVEKTLGVVDYSLTESKIKSRKFSRSLFVVKDIKKGEILTEKNVRSIRPGDGMSPKYYKEILGEKAKLDIEFGTPLQWELIEK